MTAVSGSLNSGSAGAHMFSVVALMSEQMLSIFWSGFVKSAKTAKVS